MLAAGQEPDSGFFHQAHGVQVRADGEVKVSLDMMTGCAGGDPVPGERSIIASAGHGKRAARHNDAWLRGGTFERAEKDPLATFGMLHLPVYCHPPSS